MSDQPLSTLRTPQRLVRVFISSTFRDMQAQRRSITQLEVSHAVLNDRRSH
jgi:hypothetical protein